MARFCSEGICSKRVAAVGVGVAAEGICADGYEDTDWSYGAMGSEDVLSHCCPAVHWLSACAEGS